MVEPDRQELLTFVKPNAAGFAIASRYKLLALIKKIVEAALRAETLVMSADFLLK
ncbi:hypothetical protein [Nostoc sp. KVJ20]|uniref:hypothetical protein n=1 Tax=Nostoc sp. KVJ20 TaxID=457944 RepID=UPI00159F295D